MKTEDREPPKEPLGSRPPERAFAQQEGQREVASTRDIAGETVPLPILATKLHRPAVALDILPRARLLEQLNEGRQRPLTLVSAPAGYGKSTLASRWLDACDGPGIWVSLDENDNDLRSFLAYVLAAVQAAVPNSCQKTQALLDAPNLPLGPVLARYLLNDLDQIDEPFILVLDDYHHIREAAVHDMLTALLDHPPRAMHLVLLTRRDPPLPISKLRARSQVTEIAAEQLRFTVAETAAFLEKVLKVSVDETTAGVLEQKTEGWVTGLRLAALSLRDHECLEQLSKSLQGNSRHIAEYLTAEVIAKQPACMTQYLLEISILDRFCEPLCAAVHASHKDCGAAETSGEDFIAWLEQSDMLVVPLDAEHRWFRCHHLFQQLLRGQLESRFPSEKIAAMHSRASGWFAENGQIDEAITHSLAAGDALAAARIVERNRRAALDADQLAALGKWLNRLPREIVQKRPGLLLGKAWILFTSTRMAEIFPVMEQVESFLDENSAEPVLLSEVNFFRGVLCYFQNEGTRSVEFFTKATELLNESSFVALRSETAYWICVALHLSGQRKTAIRMLHEGIRRGESQDGMILSRLIFGLCFLHMLEGDSWQAFHEGSRLSEVCRSKRLVFAETWAMYVQGNASFQMFDLDAAQHHFSRVVENRYISNYRAAVDAMAGLSLTQQFMGKPEAADATMRLVREYAQGAKAHDSLAIVRSCQARLALLRGDVDSATRWRRSLSETSAREMPFFFLEIPAITDCRVLIAQASEASLKEAMERLETLRLNATASHNHCQLMEILILQAQTLHCQRRTEEALEILRQAVAIAEPGAWIRPFVARSALVRGLRLDHFRGNCPFFFLQNRKLQGCKELNRRKQR